MNRPFFSTQSSYRPNIVNNNNYPSRPLLQAPVEPFNPHYGPTNTNYQTGLLGHHPVPQTQYNHAPYYPNFQIPESMQVPSHSATSNHQPNHNGMIHTQAQPPPPPLLPSPPTAVPKQNGPTFSQSLPYELDSGVHSSISSSSEYGAQSDLSRFLLKAQQPLQSPESPFHMNRSWSQFQNNTNTIVFENGDDIQMVTMDDYDYASDGGSPYDPAQNLSLLDLDYNLTKDDDEIAQLNAISAITMEVQADLSHNDDYWQAMGDRDYRFSQESPSPSPTFKSMSKSIVEKLRIHRHLSGKKKKRVCKRKKKKSISIDINAKKVTLDKVDDLAYDDLISMYKKLKEELTLLNCDDSEPASPLVTVQKEDGSSDKPIDLDIISSDEMTDDGTEQSDSQQLELEKDEANMLSIVLEKGDLGEGSSTIPNGFIKEAEEEFCLELAISSQDSRATDQLMALNSSDTGTLFASNTMPKSKTQEAMDENLLREQLIRNMLEKRITSMATSSSGNSSPMPLFDLPASPKSSAIIPMLESLSSNNGNQESVSKAPEPVKLKIDLSRYRLVIQLSDSEDSLDDEEETFDELIANPMGSRQKVGRVSRSNGFIHKLSTSQQEEYQKLKREIERRELKSVSSENLQKCEAKLKESMMLRKRRSQKVGLLKHNMTNARKELKKSKAQVRQLQNMLAAANKKVSLFTVKLQLGSKELSDAQSALKNDMQTIKHYRKMCLNMGRTLNGLDYAIPVIAEPRVPNNFDQRRKRVKSFTEVVKDNLVKSTNKETEMSLKFLRGKVKSLLKTNNIYGTVFLFEHYVSFNFVLFQSSNFYMSSHFNIEFNEFSEKRSDVLNGDLDRFPQLNSDNDLATGNYSSVLQHFNSYRFASPKNEGISSNHWSNGLNPNQLICNYELSGVCNDVNCKFQHQKDYLYGPEEKMMDVLTFVPQLDESLNLSQYRNDPKALRNVLINFVQSKLGQSEENSIESVCQEISNEIRSQSKTSVSSFLIRSIPKELVNFGDNAPLQSVQVPFDDYLYRFDLKDESFQMKLSQLCNLQASNDPDFYLKNRFFAPEGIPISAQLEAALSNDPHNTQMWINLAYCYLKRFREGQFDINFCINSSLNVLSRALEANPSNTELYEQFLLFYSNKLDLITANEKRSTQQEDIVPIDEICRRILQFCSTYRLWICYLILCDKLSHKENVVMRILEQFCSGKIECASEEEQSRNVVEIIMYRINLSLQLNKHEEAVRFFNEIFSERIKSTADSESSITNLSSLITAPDRSFVFLCYIHLILYKCLPYHCFQLDKKSCFLHLNDTRPFVINWKNSSDKDLLHIETILHRAIKNCCATAKIDNILATYNCNQLECHNSCFALRFNLAQLSKVIQSAHQGETAVAPGSEIYYSYSYLSTVYSDNFVALSHLHILQLFDIDLCSGSTSDESIVLNLIENFYNSYKHSALRNSTEWSDQMVDALKHQVQFDYWLAFYHYKCGNLAKCKQVLTRSLSYFYRDALFSCDLDERFVRHLYELILFDDFAFDAEVPFAQQEAIRCGLKFGRDKRASKLVYLYLSYIMFLHVTWRESHLSPDRHYLKLDCVFSSVVNSFTSCNLTTNDDYKFLWLNYFLILLEFPYSESHFQSIYETLRLICVTFNSSDPIFIFHLTNAFSELIVPTDRLYFLIEISKLNPNNANLIIKVLNLALHLSKKESCWNFILHIVYQKKTRLQCFEFWKIAISLSIERNDSLNTHKFLQMAISLMPFNVELWEMFKNYETSINHTEHLRQLKHFYQNTLEMTHQLFDEK